MMLLRALTILLLCPAWAQAAGEGGSASADLFRILAGMGLVLGLLLLLYGLSRRGLKWMPGSRSGAITIKEVRPLGARKALYLVEVRGQELLLGVGPDRIGLLCRLGEAPEDFDQALQNQMDKST